MSFQVYDQLNALAKQNPWFVANLQKIMASQSPASSPTASGMLSPHGAEPAQAALILLLAGKMAHGSREQTASLVSGIVKQMSSGINATEILRGIIKPQHNEDLIQAAIKLASEAKVRGTGYRPRGLVRGGGE
mgnify:CR=1 FL=1